MIDALPVLPEHFNSRPSARGDDMHFREADAEVVFQFTPLREGRRTATSFLRATSSYFNSRPSARGDIRKKEKK